MEIRYNAIILRKKEIGETDRLYTMYTRTAGKIQLVAKGVRKSEAKLAGQLETLMYGMVIVVKGRGAGRIAGAVAEQSFLFVRTDGDILKQILETVHIFERLIEWDEPDEELFDLLLLYLTLTDALAKQGQKEKIFLVTEGFLIQMFAHLGYTLETSQCVISGERLQKGGRHFFSPSAGGILSEQERHRSEDAFLVSENSIKLVRLFLANKLDTLSRVAVSQETLREIHHMILRFSQWIEH
ncbi:MAG: DNA repair protein RecO [Candidatus Moranbacteria bacterium]|nr:DNA repair protein RecO [Candidatus Moranbacteria bacterium]MDD3964507.1 DNA repair protein RecO [Candidatus Moranbacteria bacterium]